jgi:hypothetical protein
MISLNMHMCNFLEKIKPTVLAVVRRYLTLPFIAATFRFIFNYHIQHFFWWVVGGTGLRDDSLGGIVKECGYRCC